MHTYSVVLKGGGPLPPTVLEGGDPPSTQYSVLLEGGVHHPHSIYSVLLEGAEG